MPTFTHLKRSRVRIALKGLIALSLLLNVVLVFALIFPSAPAELEKNSPPPESSSTSVESSPEDSPPEIRWRDLDAESPAELAANLRDIGCAERLVQNLLAAEIDRAFHARRRKLTSVTASEQELKKATGRRQLEFHALSAERRRVIEETLGMDWVSAPSKEWGGIRHSQVTASFFGDLDPDHAERAFGLYWRALKSDQWNKGIAHALPPEEFQAFNEERYARFRTEISEIMSPDQQELAELQFYAYDIFDVWSPKQQFGRPLSSQETRDMLRILMPPDYWATRFKVPLANDEELSALRLHAMIDRFGSEVVEHFRNFESRKYLPSNQVFPKE